MLELLAFLSAATASYSYFRVRQLRQEIERRHPGFEAYVRGRSSHRFHW